MAQTDKWVKDLVTELEKKSKEELEPRAAKESKSNLIEPTLVESKQMVELFRDGLSPWEVIPLVKRGNLTFSFEQVNDALVAWQGVLGVKIAPKLEPVENPENP